MKIDSRAKKNSYIFFVETDEPPSVLLIGFSGILKKALIEYLEKNGCLVYQKKEDCPKMNFAYIFQKDNLNQLTKNLALAEKTQARFIIINSINNPKIASKVKKILAQSKVHLKTYFLTYPQINTPNLDNATLIINDIFSKIFSTDPSKIENSQFFFQKSSSKKPIGKNFFSRLPSFPLVIISALFLSFIIYFFSISLSFYFGIKNLEETNQAFLNGEVIIAKKHADKSYQFFSFSKNTLNLSLPFLKIISYQEGKAIEDILETMLLLAKTLSEANFVASLAQNIGDALISSRTSLHISQLETLKTETQELNQNLSLLALQLSSIRKNQSFLYRCFQINKKMEKGEEILKQTKELLTLFSKISSLLPEVLGFDKPKTFLLLFQNNTELRPTGGFIGSFGWITFANGRLTEFKIEDVYTADGQLKGHVPPPQPIKKYLSQENWYLRDSNFDPDFMASAQQAEWFLKHEMNLTFDGVFAFDLNSAQAILRSINGVYLSDYVETITADNLFLKTQAAAEIGFFPGSTQKRDFLGSLGRAIFIKLTNSKIAWGKLIKEIKSSLDNKHILLYFHNESVQQIIEEAGWGGRIASLSCQEEDCLSDYLMIVEANLGINKANFLITRKAQLNISVLKNQLWHELVIDYTNEIPSQVYPGGHYFSYTRVLLPSSAQINNLTLADKPINREELTIESYQDKTSVGFPLKVETQTTKTVKLTYFLPLTYKTSNLELLLQKQPGVTPFTFDISITTSNKINKSILISADHLLSFPLFPN